MTVEYAQEIKLPVLHVKQAIIHQCVFLLPLGCIIIGLEILEWSIPGTLSQFFKATRQAFPTLTELMRGITKYSSIVLLLFYAWQIRRAYASQRIVELRFLVASIAIYYTALSCALYVLKIGVGSPRPYADANSPNPFSLDPDFHSFPSGHTAECSAITSTLAHFFSAHGATLFLGCLLGLVAFSRVFIGMHHPIDLLPGALLGSLAPVLAAPLVHKKFWQRLPFAKVFCRNRSMGCTAK